MDNKKPSNIQNLIQSFNYIPAQLIYESCQIAWIYGSNNWNIKTREDLDALLNMRIWYISNTPYIKDKWVQKYLIEIENCGFQVLYNKNMGYFLMIDIHKCKNYKKCWGKFYNLVLTL